MSALHHTALALAVVCALAAAPTSAASLAQARQATDAREFDRALQEFNALLRAQPDNSDLLIETARVYGFADRHQEAIATYQRVLALAPQRRNDIVGALAWQTLWAGDGSAARPLFVEAQALVTAPPERAALLRGEGEACAAVGDVPCALGAWQRALVQQPLDRDLRQRIATAYLWLDDYPASVAMWRALLRKQPGDKRAQAGLARALNAAGRHNDAIALYRGVDDGSDADLRFDHARALRWAGYDAPAQAMLADRRDADAIWLRDWRLSFDLGREALETPLAIQNRITVDVAAVGIEHRLPPRWAFAAGLANLRFSDGNDCQRITGKLDYALRLGNPRVVVGVDGMAFSASRPASFSGQPPAGTTTPKGYWNPKNYHEARLVAGVSAEQQPWEWYGRVALGLSRETDGDGVSSSGHPNLLELGVAHDVDPSWRWRLFAGGSGSGFAVGNGGAGYWRRYIGFNLTAWF